MKKLSMVIFAKDRIIANLLTIAIVLLIAVGAQAAQLDCTMCHGNGNASTLTPGTDAHPIDTLFGSPATYRNVTTGAVKGSHNTHFGQSTNGVICSKCHGSASAPTTSYQTNHAILSNFSIRMNSAVKYNKGAGIVTSFKQTATPTLGSCTTVNCHFESVNNAGSTPVWGSVASFESQKSAGNDSNNTCNNCHTGAALATGKHAKHIASYGNALTACAKCHPDNYTAAGSAAFTHATSTSTNIAVIFTAAPNSGSGAIAGRRVAPAFLPSAGTPSTATCSSLYCHSSGQSSTGAALTAPNYTSPAWNDAALTCGGCHKNMVSDVAATGNHVKHAQTAAIACATCHNGYTSTTTNAATHVDGSINLSFTGNGASTVYSQGNTHAPANGYGKCSTSYCHSAAQSSTGGALVAANYSSATWGGVARNCGGCHKNMVSDVAAPGSHVKHAQTAAIVCATCHNGYTSTTTNAATHADGSINLSFSGTAASTVYSQGNAHAPANGYGTCSTSVCHSSGQAADGTATPTYGTPTWGAAALTCAGCHKDMSSDGTAPGSHVKHAQTAAIACAICHNGYTATTTNAATHVDNQINLSFSGNGASTIYSQGNTHALGNGYGKCSTSYCHSAGQSATGGALVAANYSSATWGGVARNCGGCHKNMVSDVAATGNHVKHAQTAAIACATCHNGYTSTTTNAATHVDGSINLSFTGNGASTVYSQGNTHAPANGYGKCSTSYCHSAAQSSTGGALVAANYSSATWGGVARNCGGCHKNMVSDVAAPGSHVKHAQTAAIVCATCHNGYTSTTTNAATHADGSINLSFSGTAASTVYSQGNAHAPANGYGTCSTSVCHSSGQAADGTATPTYGTPTWGAAALTCAGCHKDMSSDGTAPGSHVKHAQTAAIACAICHNGYTATTTNAATHVDNQINLSFSGNGASTIYSQGNTHALGNGYGKCSTSYCHSAGQSATGGALVAANYSSATWGGVARNCGGCHKNMVSDVAATGNHVKHAQTAAIACATCHNGYTSTTTNAATHVDGSINLSFTGNGASTVYSQGNTHAPANGYGKCSTSYCHSAAQSSTGGALVAANYSSATWGGVARNCGGCHKNMLSDVAAPGSHVKHAQTAAIVCATCHNGYTSTTTNAATHADGSINLSFSGTAASTVYSQGNAHAPANGFGTCSTSVCHSSGQAADGTATPTYGTPTWGAAALTCAGCHKDMSSDGTAPGSHVKHAQTAAIACAICHNGYTATTTNAATHVDNQINLSFSGNGASTIYSQGNTHALGNGYGKCSTSYCHSAGQSATGGALVAANYSSATWGGVARNCGGCHKNMVSDVAATGNHVKHAQTAAIACATCHNGYTSTTTNAATHVDGSINLSFTGNGASTVYSQGNTHAPANGYGKCSTSYCHSAAQSSTGGALVAANYSSATWGGVARNCGGCHKNMVSDVAAPGSHVKHAQTAAIVCATCHNGYTSTTTNAATHADGSINLSFSGTAASTVYSQGNAHAPANGYGTCSTSYCHGSASPAWGGAALTCASCHAADSTTFTSIATTGSHMQHYEVATPPASGTYATMTVGNVSLDPTKYQFNCTSCHNNSSAQHVDGAKYGTYSSAALIQFGYTSATRKGTYAYAANVSGRDSGLRWSSGTCSTVYCHSDGNDGNPKKSAFNWASPNNTLRCYGCHGAQDIKNGTSQAAATNYSSIRTQAHARHVRPDINTEMGYGNGLDCVRCHAATAVSSGLGEADREPGQPGVTMDPAPSGLVDSGGGGNRRIALCNGCRSDGGRASRTGPLRTPCRAAGWPPAWGTSPRSRR